MDLLKLAGVSKFNKPKKTPDHPTKSHVVVAKQGNEIKLIRFGQQGVEGDGKKDTPRRRAWYARHKANIAKGPLFATYWASKVKW